jgi:sugar-specific transcriptional regulator TrmB
LDKAIKNLRDLGLTYTQARIYLAVLSENPCTFGRISKLTGVPRSEVYRETIYLEQSGLVEKTLSKPRTVRVMPVETALKNFVEWKKKEHDEHISKLECALNEFVRYNRPLAKCNCEMGPAKVEFSLISKRQAIIAKTKSMLEEAEEEVFLRYSPRKMCALLNFCDNSFNAAFKKRIYVALMTRNGPLNDGLTRTIQAMTDVNDETLEVRCASRISFGLTITDKKQVLVETAADDSFSDKPMLWTDNQILLSILHQDFLKTWLNCPYKIDLNQSLRKPANGPMATYLKPV